jgi:KipI family sensor histidine kinase inhibitor
MYSKPRYLLVGDRGLSVEFGNEVNEETNHQVRRMALALEKACISGVIEFFPTFRSLFILYNPLELKVKNLIRALKNLEKCMIEIPLFQSRTFEIPVAYGGKFGTDLEGIAQFLGMSPEEVIRIHRSPEYLVYMNGFMGGAAFIKMPDELAALPRKKTPALWVPAGAVMFAGGLGNVFKALEGPTGWNIIGRSPLKQWFPEKAPPLLILAGDKVRYKPISESEYWEIKKSVEDGCYQVRILDKGEEGREEAAERSF